MKYNQEDLYGLIHHYSESKKTGCAWVLYQVNNDMKILYFECNEEKKKIVDLLVQDKILKIKDNIIQFSKIFQTFMTKFISQSVNITLTKD